MENTGTIRKLLEPVLNEQDVDIYDISWISGCDKTLQVSILKKDGTMDLDTCANMSELISEALDQSNLVSTAYMLEVCSPGAEREIKDINELKTQENAYVFIQVSEPIKNMTEIIGSVLEVNETSLKLEYRDKAAKRVAEVPLEHITFIRYAVKF